MDSVDRTFIIALAVLIAVAVLVGIVRNWEQIVIWYQRWRDYCVPQHQVNVLPPPPPPLPLRPRRNPQLPPAYDNESPISYAESQINHAGRHSSDATYMQQQIPDVASDFGKSCEDGVRVL